MSVKHILATAALALAVSAPASAQYLGHSADDQMGASGRMPGELWSPKPTTMTPYVAPNKPLWKFADIMAAHRGQSDWVQPIIRNKDQDADYIALGAGKTTKAKMYSDDRVVFIVWDGAVKVSIEGDEPFIATKGFMVNIPFRHVYTLQTTSATPSVRFEVRQAGAVPVYPGDVTPDPVPGMTYVKVTASPGPARDRPGNPTYVDFFKMVANSDRNYNDKFVWDDHFTSNILRGKGAPVPPDTSLGHFHIGWTEFWFVMEGRIGIKIEGEPYFVADAGDIITAAQGRWHRAGNDPSAAISTRIPFNPRPPIMHNFEVNPNAAAGRGPGRGRGGN